jgi:hypothetical protein
VKLFSVQRRRETTCELTETGKIKRAAPSEVGDWVESMDNDLVMSDDGESDE